MSFAEQVQDIMKSLEYDVMEKGRGFPDGTIREWKGIKHKKTNGKWIPMTDGEKSEKEEEKKQDSNATETTEQSTESEETTTVSSEIGDTVEFTSPSGEKIKGEVIASGNTGVQVKKDGVVYKVKHEDLEVVQNKDGTIPAKYFNANDYKKSFTDPKCTNDAMGVKHVYELLGPDGKETQAKVEALLNKQTQRLKKGDTQTRYMKGGEYTPKRLALHQQIIDFVLSPEKIKNATPKNGEKPKYVIFGGRGGSGKSWFTDKKRAAEQGREVMFDSDKYITLDADAIKEMLPEYEGWNASEVHEESSDLMKKIKKIAMDKGLNIIIDGTMNYNPNKPDKVKNEILEAKDKGFSTEAHYMFTPLQKSCVNAMNRFKTKNGDYSGRLVPTDILLSMQDNEKSFDSVKDLVDDWSFRDNQNFEAKIISQKSK